MASWWKEALARRPTWMNVLMLFSAWMAFVYMPWDLFVKPVAQDEEVWFGILLHGWAAKLTEPLHWAIYAAGTYGFWRMRPWMWPWAAVYSGQVAVGMLVWNVLYGGGWGWIAGIVSFVAFAALTLALWRARDRFQAPRDPLRARYGEWALVTGASAGIGAAFARALAREGLSLVLVAERAERLRALADELEKAHGVQVRTLPLDLTAEGAVVRLASNVSDLDLGLLVNNAGVGYAGRFDKQDAARLHNLVQLNCVVPLTLTHQLIGRMVARGRGAVIVVGSIAGEQPVPYLAAYSASKAFDRFLGETLWAELRESGIDVLTLSPGPTETEFQEVAGELPHPGMSPDEVVEQALDALGRQPAVIAGWRNWLQSLGVRFVPRTLTALLAHGQMRRWTPEKLR